MLPRVAPHQRDRSVTGWGTSVDHPGGAVTMLLSSVGLAAPKPRALTGRLSMQLRLPQRSTVSLERRAVDEQSAMAAAQRRCSAEPQVSRGFLC